MGFGEPVAGQEDEVEGLGHAHLGGPHLREVPGQQSVDEDVRHQDAADLRDGDACVALQKCARAHLQCQGREEAADGLRGLQVGIQSVGGEDDDVHHVTGQQHSEGGLPAGLRRVEEGREEEGERHCGEAEHEQEAQDHAEVRMVEEPAHRHDGAQEGETEAQKHAVRDHVARPVGEVGESHHAHGLLQAAALLEHDVHHEPLDEDPEGERHEEGLQHVLAEKRELRVTEDYQGEYQQRRDDDFKQIPFGLGGLQVSLPQQQLDLEEQLGHQGPLLGGGLRQHRRDL
mmetsp:Transcript_15222/g.33267  ORF Transcript_15222/g.33267 Transcript_15222/m.33267 type:complete len:287 (-) Transcript_15222:83-943(-)